MYGRPAITLCKICQVMTEAGPWHVRTLQMGASTSYMSALKQDFMAAYANSDMAPIVHYPHARLIVIQKLKAAL